MARMISKQTRKKWAKVVVSHFRVIFTYYRLSRMLLSLPRDFIDRKLIRAITWMQNKLIKHSKLDGRKSNSNSMCRYNSWSKQLPEEIMQLVLKHLCIADYLRCRAVCRFWKEAVDRAIAGKRCRPAPQLPWLILCSHQFSLKDHGFLSLSDQKIYKSSPSYMNRLNCVGSIEGWLIMVDSAFWHPEGFMKPWSFYVLHNDQSCSRFTTLNFFLNPISGARIMLPSQSTIPWDNSSNPSLFYKAKASSVPTSQHCIVAGLVKGRLTFCRPTDKSWTLIEEGVGGLYFYTIEMVERKLYAATENAAKFVMVFDIQDSKGGPPSYRVERLVMVDPMPISFRSLNFRRNGVRYETNRAAIYLLKDPVSNELFLISRSMSYAREEDPIIPWLEILGDNFIIPPKTEGFRVFKLEFNNVPRWVEVLDLGDQILFIGQSSSKFIPAAIGINDGLDDNTLLERNCIYFAFDCPCRSATPSSSRRDFGVFSLRDRSIQRHNFPKDHSHTRLHDQPVWFAPNFW